MDLNESPQFYVRENDDPRRLLDAAPFSVCNGLLTLR